MLLRIRGGKCRGLDLLYRRKDSGDLIVGCAKRTQKCEFVGRIRQHHPLSISSANQRTNLERGAHAVRNPTTSSPAVPHASSAAMSIRSKVFSSAWSNPM